MARVLSILTSHRKNGYTSQIYAAAVQGIRETGAEVDEVWLPDYSLKPCISCFACVRDEQHRCALDDDMGRNGAGPLMAKVKQAHAIFLADPVYMWSTSARAALFFERLYPFLWTGGLEGMPFAAAACASNQGMMHEATRQFCKVCYTYKFHWVDALDVHLADFENKLKSAQFLGRRLAKEAARVEKDGPVKLLGSELAYEYLAHKWNPIEEYIRNLTQGTFDWSKSLPYLALSENRFQNPEAVSLLQKACDLLEQLIRVWRAQDLRACSVIFNELAAAWTGATWTEFLEGNVIRAEKPRAYRSAD